MFWLTGTGSKVPGRILRIGQEAWAADLEEEMKMTRFRWGEPEDEQF